MDSWIKTYGRLAGSPDQSNVSTLVLMDSWIKTAAGHDIDIYDIGFNPCFNGFMDKDQDRQLDGKHFTLFQPLF